MLSACAPRLQEIGPPVDQPALTEKAIHTADGKDLFLRTWLPWQGPERDQPKAVILALHGFNDHSGGLALPGHGLARRGFAVYAYDQRGFGKDPQTQSDFNTTALDLAAHAVPWMTVVPTGLRLKASDNRRALIALARDPLVIKQTRVDAAYGLVELMTRAYDAIPKLGHPRYLVLAGGKEAILNKGAFKTGLALLPDLPPEQGRLARYPKAYHLMLRDWDAPRIYDDIAAWIEHPAAPLPSGADAQP